MAAALRIADPEIEANAAEFAAGILEHPLAHRLGWHTLWVLTAIRAESMAIRPTIPVLRLALAGIDAAEIAVGLEVP